MLRKFFVSVVGTMMVSLSASAYYTPKVIYGDDNRSDVYQVADVGLRGIADSTVAMIPVAKMTATGRGMVHLKSTTFGDEFGLCKDEPYYSQPTAAMCSGFLVGPDLIATAGHCIQASDCDRNTFVFGFKMAGQNMPPQEIPAGEVYRCKEVVARELTRQQDYALVRLDRPVTGHQILRLQNASVMIGDGVTVIGHPSGLPTKITDGANVRRQDQGFFVANLDTYGGNSGSAVFNSRTLEVVGILVRGERDFVYDSMNACTRSNKCPADGCRGEDVTNISYIANALANVH